MRQSRTRGTPGGTVKPTNYAFKVRSLAEAKRMHAIVEGVHQTLSRSRTAPMT